MSIAARPRADSPSTETLRRVPEHSGNRLLTVSLVISAVVFVALTLGTSLIGRTAFYGGAILLNSPPWIVADFDPVPVVNPMVGDTVDFFIPGRAEMVERVRAGDWPGWTSRPAGGMHLASVPNYGLLAPTAAAWWILPSHLAPGWERLTILVVAAAGMALFLRRLRLNAHASWLAGLVYAGSGFMMAWTNWPQAGVAAMLPWLFWSVERAIQLRNLRGIVPVSLSVGALLLGGFPAVTGWGLYAAAGYALLRIAVDRRLAPGGAWRESAAQLVRLSLGLILGIGLAAVQLVVFAVQFLDMDTSHRAEGFSTVVPLRMALTTLFPHTWGISGGPFYTRTNPVEANAYLGAAAVVLGVLAVTARPRPDTPRGVRTYFVAVAAGCAFLVYLQAPFTDWIGALPVFSGNAIARLVAVLLLACGVLAGFGADVLLRPRPDDESFRRRMLTTLTVLGTGAAVTLLALFVRREISAQADSPALAGLPLLGWLLLAVGITWTAVLLVALHRWRPRLATAGVLLLPPLVVAQAAPAAAAVWAQVDADRFYPETAMHRYLTENLGHDRLATTETTMVNGTPDYYGLRSSTGHAFFSPPYGDLIDRIHPLGRLTPTYWNLPADQDLGLWQSPGLDRLATRYLATDARTALPGIAVPPAAVHGEVRIADRPVELPLPGGALRGVVLDLVGLVPESGYLEVQLVDDRGDLLASTRRLIAAPQGPGALSVPIAAEDLANEPVILRLAWDGIGPGPVVAGDPSGLPAVTTVRPADDGLRLASDDNGAVWERLTSLPRIRWAAHSLVMASSSARADAVALHDIAPDTVILSEPGRPTGGRPAQLEVREDSGDTVAVDVTAGDAGYLVLADSIQQDWSVTVDGMPADIVAADHAFGAVHVPTGSHEVVFTYSPRGQTLGFVISGVSLAVLLLLALPSGFWSRLVRAARRARA